MPVAGKRLMPREIASLCYRHGWTDTKDLVVAVAVCLSESNGYPRAWNDNVVDGVVKSRDLGLFQLNHPAKVIGTAAEENMYIPGWNVQAARQHYLRAIDYYGADFGWKPWYGWLDGYATDPAWWVKSRKTGRWFKPGRYLHRALRGVANFQAAEFGVKSPASGLFRYTRIPDIP